MSRLHKVLKRVRARTRAFAATPRGKLALRVGRGLLLLGIVAFLALQLTEVGWGNVWEGLPRTPWFYAIVLGMYFILPLSEAGIYGWLWHVPFHRLLGISLRKRVLNADVLGYSGDVYFGVWAHRTLGLSEREVWRVYKDNTVLSALASFASVALLLGGLWFGGFIAFADLVRGQNPIHLAVGLGIVLLLASAALTFRRAIFSLPARIVATLFAIHTGRFVLGYVLQVAQWWVVLPEAPFEVWGTMLAVMTLMNRLPLVPARDLISIGAILGMADVLAASEAVLAGMLLARSGIDRVLNASFFGGSLLWERRHPTVDPGDPLAHAVEAAAEPPQRTTSTS
jgi:hypothetical protein